MESGFEKVAVVKLTIMKINRMEAGPNEEAILKRTVGERHVGYFSLRERNILKLNPADFALAEGVWLI